MTDRIEVCPEADLDPGDRELVSIDGERSIGVFNVDGEYYALLNRCLHQGGPLCEGSIHPRVEAEPGDTGERVREYYTDEHVLVCPWHDWGYDLETGDNVANSDISVPVFDVVVEDGTVFVEV